MKLSVCLLLVVVAATSADKGFYQPQQAVQSAYETSTGSYIYDDYEYSAQPQYSVQPQREGYVARASLLYRLASIPSGQEGQPQIRHVRLLLEQAWLHLPTEWDNTFGSVRGCRQSTGYPENVMARLV